jgi:hypothetical protein
MLDVGENADFLIRAKKESAKLSLDLDCLEVVPTAESGAYFVCDLALSLTKGENIFQKVKILAS